MRALLFRKKHDREIRRGRGLRREGKGSGNCDSRALKSRRKLGKKLEGKRGRCKGRRKIVTPTADKPHWEGSTEI